MHPTTVSDDPMGNVHGFLLGKGCLIMNDRNIVDWAFRNDNQSHWIIKAKCQTLIVLMLGIHYANLRGIATTILPPDSGGSYQI